METNNNVWAAKTAKQNMIWSRIPEYIKRRIKCNENYMGMCIKIEHL